MKVLIEMPMGTDKKIEVKDGVPTVDRVLKMVVPTNYGYIPNTLAEDGDPVDAFVISKKDLKTLDLVDVEIIGIYECFDQGIPDNKLLTKVKGEKYTDNEILSEMVRVGHYLLNYKEGFKVTDYKSIKKGDFIRLIHKYTKE